jgi:lipopolysaccharide transport system ATP-binding protein
LSKKIIKVENLSKAYQLGDFSTGTISRDLERYWARVRGKEDPFLKIGEINNRATKSESDIVWSLKDINFEIEQGDAVGIIGRNGAGKSTLLKILSRITSPTTGSVKIKGRMASLLEVGTGFHPELTGRENIYLNGAILGMRKSEITRKFAEIVDFSGVERYIDTPVKRYSSGMYVRLAFAVAAHLESEILIVDEVLAVGDAEFQKKCLGKMNEVSQDEGRTILFVSHNMGAIKKLCNNGIFLNNGLISLAGDLDTVISKYLHAETELKAIYNIAVPENSKDMIGHAYQLIIEDNSGNLLPEIPVGRLWRIRVLFVLNRDVKHFIIGIGINTDMDVNVRTCWSNAADMNAGSYEVVFFENDLLLASGSYKLIVGLSSYETTFQYLENIASLNISDVPDENLDKSILRYKNAGLLLNPMAVKISSIK